MIAGFLPVTFHHEPWYIIEKIVALERPGLELCGRIFRSGQPEEGYYEEMVAMHWRNAEELEQIIDVIGSPTIDRVGREVSAATRLVIQYARPSVTY